MRTLIVAASFFAALPAAAQAAEPVQIDRDGYKLSYIVTEAGDGTRLITGRDLVTDSEFSFRVKGRVVRGDVDGRRVSFMVPATRSAATVLIPGN